MKDDIQQIRKEIDEIDQEIADLLDKRQKSVQEIKKVKAKNNVNIIDTNREETILAKLDSNYKKNIFKKIIEESRKIQEDLLT